MKLLPAVGAELRVPGGWYWYVGAQNSLVVDRVVEGAHPSSCSTMHISRMY